MKASFLRLVGVLSLVCLISALLVAVAHHMTQRPIAQAAERQKAAAVLAVQPTGAELVKTHIFEAGEVAEIPAGLVVFETTQGFAFEVEEPTGYAGPIRLMLGFTKSGVFWRYQVLSHSETPGLGAHIAGSFVDHVKERPLEGTIWRVTKDGGSIEPITAATISSRAVCAAIARGAEIVQAFQKGVSAEALEVPQDEGTQE